MGPSYILERWPLGWLFCSINGGHSGIPINALNECMRLFPKGAVMDAAIVHHLRQTGKADAVMCVVADGDGERWREHILEAIKYLPSQERWWKGLDVGASSAAIFAVFCDEEWRSAAQEVGRGSIPRDADDFGRCLRLLELFPEWRMKLADVSDSYPESDWPKIVARWDEIEKAPKELQSKILREI